MTAYEDGYRKALQDIVAWHREQGKEFNSLSLKLDRLKASPTDIMRAYWASASHHAHATHIEMRKVKRQP